MIDRPDPRYESSVNGVSAADMPDLMRRSMEAVQRVMPAGTGVIVFAFSFAGRPGNALGYISNAYRADCIAALEEWIRRQREES